MQAVFDQAAFEHWLNVNSKNSPRLSAPLSRTSFLQVDPGRPVIANGVLTGSRVAQSLQLDANYRDAPASGKVDALKIAPATGCSMLLTIAREKSGYDCRTPAQPDSEQKFMQYVDQITLCPMFHKDIDDRIVNGFQGDWNDVINRIVSLYAGLPEQDCEILRKSLWSIASAASSNPATQEKMCTFFQSTIDSNDNISVFFFYTYVQMVTYVDRGGKNEPDHVRNQADLVLHRVKMSFDALLWPPQAAVVYQETQSSLASWIDDNSTPPGSLATNWHPR